MMYINIYKPCSIPPHMTPPDTKGTYWEECPWPRGSHRLPQRPRRRCPSWASGSDPIADISVSVFWFSGCSSRSSNRLHGIHQ